MIAISLNGHHKNGVFRSLFALLISILLMCTFTGKSFGQQRALDEVTALAVWKEEYLGIIDDVILLQDIETIDIILSYAYADDKATQKKFDEAVKIWEKNLNRNIPALRTRAKNLPPPPPFSTSPEMRNSFVVERNNLDDFVEGGIQIAAGFSAIFKRIRSGDDTAITELLLAQVDAGRKVIIADNGTITTAILTIAKDNPQHNFLQLLLADNQFALHEMALTKLSILDTSTQKTRLPLIENMKMEVIVAKKYINSSKKITQDQFATIRKGKFAYRTQQEKAFFRAIMSTESNFFEAFEVEKQIIALHEQSIALYASDLSIEEIEEKIEPIDVQYYELIDERARLYSERLNAIVQLEQ